MNLLEMAERFPHFLRLEKETEVLCPRVQLFLDHHTLSTYRLCPAKFVEEHLYHLRLPGKRYWSLEFGLWIHDCLASYYDYFKKKSCPPPLDEFLDVGKQLWINYKLEEFKPRTNVLVKDYWTDEKKYHLLGGLEGALRLLVQYYAFYMNQRMRVVATEISFGKNEEVYLGSFVDPITNSLVECFLSGRIDLLVDNGYKIGPVDHKSTARFDGYESDDYNPHEGITGYIYAIDRILKLRFPDNPHKICRDGWIFHISFQDYDPRFKPSLISKTPQQLEEYASRQVRTFRNIFELLTSSSYEDLHKNTTWNTMACNNIYNNQCTMRELHRQPTEQRNGTIKQFYQIGTPWQPENQDKLVKK
jgi:PD-(D/E)XK nuclease superfamily protein